MHSFDFAMESIAVSVTNLPQRILFCPSKFPIQICYFPSVCASGESSAAAEKKSLPSQL
jgi:hypothetical protein